MENLKIYNEARVVPLEAKKPIKAGRLKGMTDISPMWRIKKLTEMFGPCGVGWWYDIIDKRIVDDEITKQKAAFVDIKLYYLDPDTGHESHGIPGTGGASFVAQESKGAYLSDECFKMALTDAISVASKALGVGADVYWDKDSKYSDNVYPVDQQSTAALVVSCEECGAEIKPIVDKKGRTMQPMAIADYSLMRFGKCLCPDCQRKANA